MKKSILSRVLVIVILFLSSNVLVWGQEISFDISKGNVRFTDTTYSGYNSAGTQLSGAHNPDYHYIISGTTTTYNVQVGDKDNFVTKNYIIYLNGVDISTKTQQKCAFAVYNQGSSKVAVILKDRSQNKLYSGYNRAGLEKSGGYTADGTLVVTCEAGFAAWKTDPTKGHTTHNMYNESACTDICGHLDARSGNAWDGSKAAHYHAGAGIGTAGEGSGGSNKENAKKGTNALINLTIAGGNIEARGAWGYSTATSGGAAAIGTGCALDSNITAGTISGLKITGGNITAYRIDNSAACIGGGYRSGYVTMDIYGGTIDATQNDDLGRGLLFNMLRAAAIGGGGGGNSSSSPAGATVTIHNGVIKAKGQYGSAIGSGSGGKTGYGQYAKVTIHNGYIEASTSKGNGEGSGAAIGSGGSTGTGHAGNADIIINGGTIIASSELGADIGGGGTNSVNADGYGGTGNVTINGGTITVSKGGIGGGRANAGIGGSSTIVISGENTTITANSIGGGRSAKNTGGDVNLTVNAGKLTVADFIGGGVGGADNDKIGCATVNIHGGDISGRILMRASEGKGCLFNMTGGKLTSPITDKPGGAVYMIDPKGVATMSGGTIYNCEGTTGGAVYMSGGKFNISGGTLSNCTGNDGGGAVYMAGGTFDISGGQISGCHGLIGGAVYLNNGTCTISGSAEMNNNNAANGGAVYLADNGKFYVNGGTIKGNDAAIVSGNGGAVYMNNGEFAMTGGSISNYKRTNGGAVYMAGGTFDISGGTISGCEGAAGGAVYLNNGTFTISGSAIMQNNSAPNGGAAYLAGTGKFYVNGGTIKGNDATVVSGNGGAIYMNNGEFAMTGGSISNYKRTNGGAVYMAGGTFDISGGTISDCEGTAGGAVYLNNGTFTISNSAAMQNNSATNGGAAYLAGEGKFNVNGGAIESNSVSGNGGAFYLTAGEFTMNSGKVASNRSTSGNGAGIYIANGTVTVGGGEISGNVATAGMGGGFYVGGGTVNLSNGHIVSNKAAKAGGGIYLNGATVNVNGCTLTENEATAGNGGGIFLTNGANMTYNGGILTFNKATGTGDFKTAYKNDGEDIQGVGGGIYISTNSSLSFGDFQKLGVYANIADMAADDVFVNGDGTTLVLPNIAQMSLDSYAGNADGLGWYEDYFVDDESYNQNNVAKGSFSSFVHRFRDAQMLGSAYMREYEYGDNEETKTFTNTYVAFALGFLFSDLTIQVEGLKPGESCIFSVVGTAEGGKYKYQVPVYGTTNQYDVQKIVRLPIDKYTVTMLQGWPWAYDGTFEPNNGQIVQMNNINGGIYQFKVEHTSNPISHDEEQVKVNLK